MEKRNFAELTDEELLVEKRKLRKAKITSAVFIGFMAGVLIFGVVSWSLSEEKRFGFLIPMLIPVVIIYRMLKNRNMNKDLEETLRDRNLN